MQHRIGQTLGYLVPRQEDVSGSGQIHLLGDLGERCREVCPSERLFRGGDREGSTGDEEEQN